MNAPDIAQALVTETGLMALVVMIAAGVAVGLTVFVLEVTDCIEKKERDDGPV